MERSIPEKIRMPKNNEDEKFIHDHEQDIMKGTPLDNDEEDENNAQKKQETRDEKVIKTIKK